MKRKQKDSNKEHDPKLKEKIFILPLFLVPGTLGSASSRSVLGTFGIGKPEQKP